MFFLALRNIAKNKKNSAILVLFIAVIAFLFFMGNSVIGSSDRSLRRTYVESLTGDVVLEKSEDISLNLFGANAPVIDSYFAIPVFPAYDTIMELVAAEEGIAGITSQVSGRAYMRLLSVDDMVLLCGADVSGYFRLFPGIVLEEGQFLRPGELGAMITLERARRIERQSGRSIEIGMPVLFTSGSNIGIKIREVPLVGIFSYKNPGQYMNEIVIIDPQTVRILNSIQVAGSADVDLGEDVLGLLSADPDDLFGETFSSSGTALDEGFSAEMLHAFLRDSPNEEADTGTGGDWNFIIIRLKEGWPAGKFISSINKKISAYGLIAVNWRTAAGTSAILLLLLQALFNAGVFLVSIAGVIAVINILLISVFHRTREIGTLRAIGASDAYIRFLIISENLVISLVAGFTGVLGGILLLRWINSLRFQINNNLIASLLGGSTLHLEFLPHVGIFSVVVAVVLGFAASVYPIEVAVHIEPMAAVRRG